VESVFAIIFITCVAAITPGPNNIIVMNIAVQQCFSAVLNPIIAILLGAIFLTLIAWGGVAIIIANNPMVNQIIGLFGASYLIWLGASMIYKSRNNLFQSNALDSNKEQRTTPSSLLAIFLFQFMNPKAWILITTIATELASHFSVGVSLLIQLVVLLVVSLVCLLIWAKMGSYLSGLLVTPRHNFIFNLLMGSLLIVPAISFIVIG
jgi:threonine/homoserine/homoserine lactone efflux protein